MKRLTFLAIAFVLVIGGAGAMDLAVGLDAEYSRDASSFSEDDAAFVDTDLEIAAVAAFDLSKSVELAPFVGMILEQQRDADLSDPIIDRQFGFVAGTGFYVMFIEGEHLDFSVGPRGFVSWLLQPASSGASSYIDLGLDVDLYLNMDLALPAGWYLRFGVPTVFFVIDYDKRDDLVDFSINLASQVTRGSALISLRKQL